MGTVTKHGQDNCIITAMSMVLTMMHAVHTL